MNLDSLFRHTELTRFLLNTQVHRRGGVGSLGIQMRLSGPLAGRPKLGPESTVTELEQRSEVWETRSHNADCCLGAGPYHDGDLVVYIDGQNGVWKGG